MFNPVAHIDEVIALALGAWSAVSVMTVLIFGALVRAGRRSWTTPATSAPSFPAVGHPVGDAP